MPHRIRVSAKACGFRESDSERDRFEDAPRVMILPHDRNRQSAVGDDPLTVQVAVGATATSPNKVLRNGDKRRSRPQGLALLEACRRLRMPRRWGCPPQSPAPGFGKKYWNLSGFPSHSLESGGGAFLIVIFGQIFAYSAFSDSHFSSPDSVSGLIASTGIPARRPRNRCIRPGG